MNDYLVFDTQTAAEAALETIYANMIGAVDSPDLLNVETQEVVAKDELTPDEVVEVDSVMRYYPVFGVNAATGQTVVNYGYTKAWAEAKETLNGKWVFQKPDDNLMAGVTGFTVEPYDPAWFPQDLAG